MRCNARKHASGFRTGERTPGQPLCRTQCFEPKRSQKERMAWNAKRGEQIDNQLVPVRDQWLHDPLISLCIWPQRFPCRHDGGLKQCRRAVVEWMGQRHWLYPFKAVICQRDTTHKWRGQYEWMDCRANIVGKTRKRELRRTHRS